MFAFLVSSSFVLDLSSLLICPLVFSFFSFLPFTGYYYFCLFVYFLVFLFLFVPPLSFKLSRPFLTRIHIFLFCLIAVNIFRYKISSQLATENYIVMFGRHFETKYTFLNFISYQTLFSSFFKEN